MGTVVLLFYFNFNEIQTIFLRLFLCNLFDFHSLLFV